MKKLIEKGFTAIELMIVIAILGICIAIGVSFILNENRINEENKLQNPPKPPAVEQVVPKESGDLKKL